MRCGRGSEEKRGAEKWWWQWAVEGTEDQKRRGRSVNTGASATLRSFGPQESDTGCKAWTSRGSQCFITIVISHLLALIRSHLQPGVVFFLGWRAFLWMSKTSLPPYTAKICTLGKKEISSTFKLELKGNFHGPRKVRGSGLVEDTSQRQRTVHLNSSIKYWQHYGGKEDRCYVTSSPKHVR